MLKVSIWQIITSIAFSLENSGGKKQESQDLRKIKELVQFIL
jgi:hypothetical protein